MILEVNIEINIEIWYNYIYKKKGGTEEMQFNLFAEETQLQRLSKLEDSLEKPKIINFEAFLPEVEKVYKK